MAGTEDKSTFLFELESERSPVNKRLKARRILESSCSQSLIKFFATVALVVMLLLTNIKMGGISDCLNEILSATFSAPFILRETSMAQVQSGGQPLCTEYFLNDDKSETLEICLPFYRNMSFTPGNITFSIGGAELMSYEGKMAMEFVNWLRACSRKDRAGCSLSTSLVESPATRTLPSDYACPLNSIFERDADTLICFDPHNQNPRLLLRSHPFYADQLSTILAAILYHFKR
jgi:hypothetical protein